MTKSFFLLILACGAAFGGAAQTSGTGSLSVGPSFPTGALGSKNVADASAGLANTGEVAALQWWQPFRRTGFGVVGSVRFDLHPIDATATLQPF